MWKSDSDAMLGKITRDVEELKDDLTKEIFDLNGRFKTVGRPRLKFDTGDHGGPKHAASCIG